jgi:hypothetical protein
MQIHLNERGLSMIIDASNFTSITPSAETVPGHLYMRKDDLAVLHEDEECLQIYLMVSLNCTPKKMASPYLCNIETANRIYDRPVTKNDMSNFVDVTHLFRLVPIGR